MYTAASGWHALHALHQLQFVAAQMAGSVLDDASTERLPTASTCINLLKLPPYRSAGAIRDKLLYAVKNVAGFDLS